MPQSPCSDFHTRIEPNLMQCHLKAGKSQPFNIVFLTLSHAYRNFSGFFESFKDAMYCRWTNPQIICFITLRKIIFELLDYFPIQSFTEWWTPLWDDVFISSHVTDMLPFNNTVFFSITKLFFSFFYYILKHVVGIK